MLRRRGFLDDGVIEASRDFVCVRLNAWLDEVHVQRVIGLMGHHQNSALALFSPEVVEGLGDAFPTAADCAWGPMSFTGAGEDLPSWARVARQTEELPAAMRELAARHPGRPDAATHPPALPVLPDLVQALNIAACDSRAVVVVVEPRRGARELERRLAPVLFEPPLAGRTHAVRVGGRAWREAVAASRIEGADHRSLAGVYVVQPEPYGRTGEVLDSAPAAASRVHLRDVLVRALDRFQRGFVKLDRSAHILKGRREGIFWNEYRPEGWKECACDGANG